MVSSMPQPHFNPGKDLLPILQEAGWAPGPVWTGRKSHLHPDSIPDHLARNQLLYQQSYPAHRKVYCGSNFFVNCMECSTYTLSFLCYGCVFECELRGKHDLLCWTTRGSTDFHRVCDCDYFIV